MKFLLPAALISFVSRQKANLHFFTGKVMPATSRASCMADLIDGPFIREYVFQGRSVYLFGTGGGKIRTIDVYDEHCNKIGMLGGEAGYNRVRGVDFFSHAVYRRTIGA
ncbi:MAG TPA: hypothetical protein VFR58_16945 [Flavisolibacter sp.]|nr:hypothetical protein [Flavisolibacter sp.]